MRQITGTAPIPTLAHLRAPDAVGVEITGATPAADLDTPVAVVVAEALTLTGVAPARVENHLRQIAVRGKHVRTAA